MFPIIAKEKMVIIRAELTTGKVLDINNIYATKPNQDIFTICDNTESALQLAKSVVQENKNIECYIYNSNNILKYKITIFEVESF